MQIQGLQKLTLLDYPGRTACTVFLSGCNFRCPFCQNSDLVISPAITRRCSPQRTKTAWTKTSCWRF